MDYYARHAGSLAALQGRLDDSCPVFSWQGKDWKIVPGSALRRADLGGGGFSLNADLRFSALVQQFIDDGGYEDVNDFQTAFQQEVIGYLGAGYKVDSVSIMPGGLQVLVNCNSSSQNA